MLAGLQPEFAKKTDEMIDIAAKIYARGMSEDELKATAAFFNSSAGKKVCRRPTDHARPARGRHAGLDAGDVELHDEARAGRKWKRRATSSERLGLKRRCRRGVRIAGENEAMSTPDKVDFFVVGAGSGGVRSARIAAGYGAKVVVAEDHRVGGTCVIRGCVPKKLYVYASRFADDFADAAGFGWTVGASRFDWPDLVAAKEKEITRLSGLYRANLEKAGASLVEGRARDSKVRTA